MSLYTFKADDQEWELPPPSTVYDKVPGKVLRDAYMTDEGDMKLAFTMLEMLDTKPGTVDALYSLDSPEMREHIYEWMRHQVEDEPDSGVTPGESVSSLP